VQYRRLVTHRPKYACRSCKGSIVQAAAPERLISGGLPTEAMVVSVVVAAPTINPSIDNPRASRARAL
jgi:transposase